MEITELKLKGRNSVAINDSLEAPVLELKLSLDSTTIIPNSNDLIVYVGKNEEELVEYKYTLTKSLSYLNNVSDEFIVTPTLEGDKVTLKSYVIRRISNNSILDKEVIEECFYQEIILNEGVNYIKTNYIDLNIEVMYPKDTELVRHFLNTSLYKSNEKRQEDLYFIDAFTKVDEGINADLNRVSINCFKLKDSPYGLDALGNLTVNSIISAVPNTSNIDIDTIYPVGSMYISKTNSNPSQLFGGTWRLIDKEFSYYSASFSSSSNPSILTIFSPTSALNIEKSSIYVQRVGHSIVFRLWFVSAQEISDDTVVFGELNLSKLGVKQLIHSQSGLCAGADAGNGIFLLVIDNLGVVSSVDVIPRGSATKMNVGSSPRIEATFKLGSSYMLDEVCNKFYWERIS